MNDPIDRTTAARRGLFLACSWTWCIGMFLPVYLVSDFGFPGWLAFVVPNIIGAAAMGMVLSSRQSAEITAAHPHAARWFSIATIVFHVSFLHWFFTETALRTPRVDGWAGGLAASAVVAAGMLMGLQRRWDWSSAVVFCISAATCVAALLTGDALDMPIGSGVQPASGLLMALPVLAFGFLLCPYLDLTFHRVRRETPGDTGSSAFLVGFGFFFALLMIYSMLYAGGWAGRSFNAFILLHISAQSAFTIGAHWRELGRAAGAEHGGRAGPGRRTALALMLLAAASVALPWAPGLRFGYPATRLSYELFMSLYALAFPAYVWIVMPVRGSPLRRRVWLWAAAVVGAAPLFWFGYIEQRYEWLPVGVGVVLAAPLALRLARRVLGPGPVREEGAGPAAPCPP